MKYLDFHQHYGFLAYRSITIEHSGNPDDVFEKIIIDNCKKLDMVVAVNGCGVYPHKKHGMVMVDKNNEVEKFFKKFPDHVIGIAYVDLDYIQPDYINKLKKRGFKGLKTIWPAERYDSKKYFEIYKRCQYLGMPILFHTGVCYILGFNGKEGAASYNMHPAFLEMVAARCPELQIVGAHLGSGWFDIACFLALCSSEANNNLKFDISLADGIRELIMSRKYIKECVPAKSLVWGLDEPPTKYEKILDQWNNHFNEIGLTREEKDRIFFKNSCEILCVE